MSLAFLHSCNPVWRIDRGPTTRNCRGCNKSKPLDDFYLKGRDSVDGTPQRFYRCKACMVTKQIARNRK